jgi:hypothetical protein
MYLGIHLFKFSQKELINSLPYRVLTHLNIADIDLSGRRYIERTTYDDGRHEHGEFIYASTDLVLVKGQYSATGIAALAAYLGENT